MIVFDVVQFGQRAVHDFVALLLNAGNPPQFNQYNQLCSEPLMRCKRQPSRGETPRFCLAEFIFMHRGEKPDFSAGKNNNGQDSSVIARFYSPTVQSLIPIKL